MSPLEGRLPSDAQGVVSEDAFDHGSSSRVRPVIHESAVPWMAMDAEGLHRLRLDARTAYLLSLIDGHCSVGMILEICEFELPRAGALTLLARMLRHGAIELREP